MAQILEIFGTLQGILLRALPTFLIFIALHWYLKLVLLKPLERVIAERRARTAGAVEQSQNLLDQANQKMADYERSLYEARAAIFAEQESARRALAAEQAEALEAAKTRTAAQVAAAIKEIAAEADSARAELAAQSDALATRMADLVLVGRN